MNIRRSVIAFSVIALTLNLSVAVHADQSSSSHGHPTSENFKFSGLRSHGYPVQPSQDQGDTSGTPATYTDQLSPLADQSNGDSKWLHNFFNNFNQKPNGKLSVVGSPAKGPISCHSGPCTTTLTGTVSLIPVWVGGWADSDVATWNSVLGNIVTSLGSASANSVALPGHVFNTNTLYFTSQSLTPPSLQWVPNLSITAPTAANVNDADVATYINTFISANPTIVPAGTTPVYIYIGANTTLLTSGFGTTYCGWHAYGNATTSSLTGVPYIAFQNFTSQYNSACSAQTTSPNGNVALDAMANIMVHEVDEVLTDPNFGAWYDANGAESADKCAWAFGTIYSTGTAKYNVQLGSLKYLIQMDWLENNLVTPAGRGPGTACSITG